MCLSRSRYPPTVSASVHAPRAVMRRAPLSLMMMESSAEISLKAITFAIDDRKSIKNTSFEGVAFLCRIGQNSFQQPYSFHHFSHLFV